MEFTALLSTSLDLNSQPSRARDEPSLPKQESGVGFLGLATSFISQEEKVALTEEINRVADENKKLKEKLKAVWDDYKELRSQMEMTSKNSCPGSDSNTASRKRKTSKSNDNTAADVGQSESSSSDEDSIKKPRVEEIFKAKISQVHVRTEASDSTLIVKDGYQWRKYGQKVTRDNPSPRAYFKCSFAPNCPVKKKVQRSVEDQSVLIATYEGEHNHPKPSKTDANSNTNRSLATSTMPSSTSPNCPSPTITLDLTKQKQCPEANKSSRGKADSLQLQHLLVEQMASALTKDQSFKAALAAAISGKLLQQSNQTEKW